MKKTGIIGPYKQLRRKHRAEWRRIQLFERVDKQVLFDRNRLIYEGLQTEDERASMLKSYTQQLLQLKELYSLKCKLLRDRQRQQIADLNVTNAVSIEVGKPVKIKRSDRVFTVVMNGISPL